MRLSLLLASAPVSTAYTLDLQVEETGDFQLFLASPTGREKWSQSAGQPRLHADGRWLDLHLDRSHTEQDNSQSSQVFLYKFGDQDVLSVNYTKFATDESFVLMEQCVLIDLKNTSVDPSVSVAKEMLMSAGPRFTVEAPKPPAQRGFFAYYDQMVGGMANGTKHGRWGEDSIPSGTMAGPVVVFNPNRAGAVAFSPASSFMSQSACHDRSIQALEFGLMGSITQVPRGTCWSVAVTAAETPTEAVNTLGSRLLAMHGKRPVREVTVQKLSYSTDNGAFYYYNAFPFSSPQEALEEVILRSEPALPLSSILLDSWWYFKGPDGGVTNWTATSDAFPEGLPKFHKRTGLPVVAHNRYWSSETTYAAANGGSYDFLIEAQNKKALPLEQRFWEDLLRNASQDWGLAVYEQDWLHNEWEGLDATLQSASLAETWLQQMGRGASSAGVKIQYCMAYTRHALASTAIPAVDQIRVSDDYQVDLTQQRPNANLYVGTSSLLAAALGLAPSKDVFWSSTTQPGAEAKYKNATEPHPELQALVSLLTAGPVAIGDRFNYTNISLVRLITAKDGTLLQPSWPAVPVDEYHTQRALGAGGPDGQLTHTYSAIKTDGAIRHWVSLLALDLKSPYTLNVSQSLPHLAGGMLAAVRPPLSKTSEVHLVRHSVDFPACGKSDYHHTVLTEVHAGCFVVLGELNKLLPMSSARFSEIQTCPDEGQDRLSMTAVGSPGERIEVLYAKMVNNKPHLYTSHCVVASGSTQCKISHHVDVFV